MTAGAAVAPPIVVVGAVDETVVEGLEVVELESIVEVVDDDPERLSAAMTSAGVGSVTLSTTTAPVTAATATPLASTSFPTVVAASAES